MTQKRLSHEEEQEFQKFWGDILYDKNGKFNTHQAKLELHDYMHMLEEVPVVYAHITDGLLSKPNYYAHTVIEQADYVTEQIVKEAVVDALLRVMQGEDPHDIIDEVNGS